MTNTDANKHLVDQFIAALFSKGDLSAVDQYLDPGFVNHDRPFPDSPDGPEGMRHAGKTIRAAFPDWRSDTQRLIAEGDLVAEQFVAHGTHRGTIMGVAPTGREVFLPGINIFRIAGGKIVERWGRLDDLGLMQQLGLVPPPTEG